LIRQKQTVPFARSPDRMEENMYQSAALAEKSTGDFSTVVTTFPLLGLAVSLLVIGTASLVSSEYMASLLLLF